MDFNARGMLPFPAMKPGRSHFDAEDDPQNKGHDSFTPRGWAQWTEQRYPLKLDYSDHFPVRVVLMRAAKPRPAGLPALPSAAVGEEP